MNVLLVDDDSVFRGRLKRSLEQHDLIVDEAQDTEEATRLIAEKAYAACCIDLKMPGKNGLELIPDLKRRWPDARIILLTGYGSAANVAEAFKSGAVDFLSKPVSTAEVLKALGVTVVPPKASQNNKPGKSLYPTLDEVQTNYLNQVLIECGGNISRAAKMLGLHRRSLQRKLGK